MNFAPIDILSTPADVVRGWIGAAGRIGSRAEDHLVARMAAALDGSTDDVRALAGGSVRHLGQLLDSDDLVVRLAGSAGASPLALSYRTRMLPGDIGAEAMDGMEPDEDEDPKPAGYRFVMSDANPDRADDIVEQGWDLDEFRSNPIAPYNHDYTGLPVGSWRNVSVVNNALRGTLVTAPVEEHPISVVVDKYLAMGVLRTVSVGFRPRAVIARASLNEEDSRYGDRGFVYVRPRLLEASVTPMPMNPRAALSRSLEDVPPEYAEGVERRLADLETPPAAPSWAPFLASDGPGFVPWLG